MLGVLHRFADELVSAQGRQEQVRGEDEGGDEAHQESAGVEARPGHHALHKWDDVQPLGEQEDEHGGQTDGSREYVEAPHQGLFSEGCYSGV